MSCSRVAVVMPSWVGDAVMATPVLGALRSHLPGAEIIGVMRPGLDELFADGPLLDRTVAFINHGLHGAFAGARLLRELKADAVLLLPNSFRWGFSAWRSGIPIRIGYARDGRGWMLTHSLPSDRKALVSTRGHYAALAAHALGVDSIERTMELYVSGSELMQADQLLTDVPRPFVLLVPGGNRADKRWPPERFAAVAERLNQSHGLAAAVTGSPSERDIIDNVMRDSKVPIVDLSARGLTLGSLKAVISRASLVITNDTGPRHIAAALRRPLVTLFGPTDHRWTTIDCPTEAIVLAEPFLPENLIADRHPQACRIDRITVKDVSAAAERVLALGRND
jgi:heptosyltransferase II